jgi:TPR repeat protein/S1-C subfamily serine protease/uncharacterized protein YecT (DUF1311 family)
MTRNRTFKAAAAVMLAVGFAASVAAGPFDDADAAYKRGDYATALRLFRPPADRDNAYAQASLGMMYETGNGVPQDYAAAARWYRKAADQGFVMAQEMLGVMHFYGQGVPQDYVQAYAWFDLAITSLSASETEDRNQTTRLRELVAGKMTPSQLSEAQKVAAERRLKLSNASRTAAVAAGAFKDGLNASKRGDYATAMRIWRSLADQGDAAAQHNLGLMYANGQGVPQNYAAAVNWFRKAADQGDAKAQSNLGYAYLNGQGVAQDDAAAMSWYRKAADQGHVTAQYNLGLMYDNGRGATRDDAAAASWFRKAADQGYVDAEFNLGAMYAKGLGVPQDYISAHMWFNLAAVGGGKDAARDRDIVTASMTPAQIAEAQRRAAEWRPNVANAAPPQAAPTATEPFEDGEAVYKRSDSATARLQAGAPQEQILVPRGSEKPSFICAEAKTAASRLICMDAQLAQLDGELGIAFQKRKAQISSPDQSKLVAEQLSWIRDRNARCELVGKNAAAIEVLASSKPCMLSAIQQRIAYLAQTDVTAAPHLPQLAPPSVAPSGQEATGIASAEAEWIPSEEFLARGIVVGNSQETVDTGLSVGSLSTFCRHGLYGTPSFDRRNAIGDVIFRCKMRNVLIQKIETVAAVLSEHKLKDRMVALVQVASNPDGSLFSNQEAITGFKRIAEVVRNIGFTREIHPDGYHCHGDVSDLRLPKFMRDPCRDATPPAMSTAGPPTPTPKTERFFGTAFFVSKDGKALTNAHVVEQCSQVRVTSAGQESPARIVARDEKNDLALLATAVKPLQAASWRLSVRQGEDIVVYGFPLTGVLASGGNVATGNVTALAGLSNDSRFLQISAPVQPGNSGGPILDRNGNVVGVVVAKLNALNVASVTGDIPQNVNFAIKASVAAAFLDAQHVEHMEAVNAAALSTPDIAERATALTAQVICIR